VDAGGLTPTMVTAMIMTADQKGSQALQYSEATERDPTVTRIAAFATNTRPGHLKHDIRLILKRNILDNDGYAIAVRPDPPFQALWAQFEEYPALGSLHAHRRGQDLL